MPDPLREMLTFDPLAEAERITGQSYKDNEGMNAATGLGMALMWEHAAQKNAVLTARGDTTFSNKLERYQAIIEANGFEHVLRVPFQHYDTPDALMVYARRDGLLLAFDTFSDESTVNGGHLYYNWRPSPQCAADHEYWGITSPGGWKRADGRDGPITEDDVWRGNHDCREALIYNIDRLTANGEFVSPWIERPFIWLLHYGDTKQDYDYDAINAERIAMLPSWVREMIGPE